MSDDKREAILLVGGRGTRLAPLTDAIAKPMLPVGGVPFIAHQIAQAQAAGINKIVLATSYLAQTFTDYFGDGSDFGVELIYAVEESALGTGGAIRNAAEFLTGSPESSIVIFNGDVLSGHDLPGQIAAHERSKADVTLYLTKVKDARAYGCVPCDQSGRVLDFLEKMENPVTDLINAGCYIFKRSIIDPIISTPASTMTSSPIVLPPKIFAVELILAFGEITQSLILFTTAGDEILPMAKSRDAVSSACGVPTSNQ
jgi:mannose-1-phosphate guanylyltransferase